LKIMPEKIMQLCKSILLTLLFLTALTGCTAKHTNVASLDDKSKIAGIQVIEPHGDDDGNESERITGLDDVAVKYAEDFLQSQVKKFGEKYTRTTTISKKVREGGLFDTPKVIYAYNIFKIKKSDVKNSDIVENIDPIDKAMCENIESNVSAIIKKNSAIINNNNNEKVEFTNGLLPEFCLGFTENTNKYSIDKNYNYYIQFFSVSLLQLYPEHMIQDAKQPFELKLIGYSYPILYAPALTHKLWDNFDKPNSTFSLRIHGPKNPVNPDKLLFDTGSVSATVKWIDSIDNLVRINVPESNPVFIRPSWKYGYTITAKLTETNKLTATAEDLSQEIKLQEWLKNEEEDE